MSMGVLKGLFEQLEQRQLAGPATPETPPEIVGVSAKPAPTLGCTPATPETPQSDDSGHRVEDSAANDPEPDLDDWNVTGLEGDSPAMYAAEIDTFTSRVLTFMRRGLGATAADDLADRLVIRDREGDDRRTCLECAYLAGRRCSMWRQAGIGDPSVGDLLTCLQRCPAFRSISSQEQP
jgi:hypothetical protein